MRKIFIFASAVIFATACDLEKEIDVDKNYDEAIFIGGHVSRKFGAVVSISRTLPPFRTEEDINTIIDDAKVYLTSGGKKIAEIKPDPEYKGEYFIRIDTFSYNSYGVLVESESLGTAYSTEQTLPDEAIEDSIVFVKGREGFVLAKFYFTNDKAQAGYYCNAYTSDRFDDEDNSINNLFRTHFYSRDAVIYMQNRQESNCHIDAEFCPASPSVPYIIEYYADFITLSPDLARYLKSAEEYNLSKEDEYFDNPYLPYSNIEGGYGIFGAYTVHHTKGELFAKDFYDDYQPYINDSIQKHIDDSVRRYIEDSILHINRDSLPPFDSIPPFDSLPQFGPDSVLNN
jgi:hypothetical protein